MHIFRDLPYEWTVGLRYTRAGRRSRRNRYISFISLISVTGIALGVAALIVVLSVMNGFQKEVTGRMLAMLAHIEVHADDASAPDWAKARSELQLHKAVKAMAPFSWTSAMLINDETMRPVLVRGVMPAEEAKVSEVASKFKQGRLDDLQPGSQRVMLGRELAQNLGVKLGDRVTAALPPSEEGGQPRLRPLIVAGLFDSGHAEFDTTLALVHMEDARELDPEHFHSGMRIRIENMQEAPQVARELSNMISGAFVVRDWTRVNRTWFAAVQSQKQMMFIILAIIIGVAAFNLVSTLTMTVKDKQADIAILRTIGASPASIVAIFVVQGMLVGLLGAGMGIGLGVLVASHVDVIVPLIEKMMGAPLLNKDIYLLSNVPADVRFADVGAIGLVALALAFVATLYPSWSAARLKPAEALHYE